MSADIWALSVTAVALGFFHCLMGPDHYVPFVAMSRVGRWSLQRTLVITVICGFGHIASSAVLGFIGIAMGLVVLQLDEEPTTTSDDDRVSISVAGPGLLAVAHTGLSPGTIPASTIPVGTDGEDAESNIIIRAESIRGEIAGWMLVAFGGVYTLWGVWYAIRVLRAKRANGGADKDSAEDPAEAGASNGRMTPWVLFVIFLFGPCEALIPLLMYPAALANVASVIWITTLFGVTTLVTMTGLVALMYLGIDRFRFRRAEPYGHAIAGAIVLGCGLGIMFGL